MPKIAAPISFRSVSSGLAAVLLLLLVGCAANPPYEDYTLAQAAIRAAQDVDSARISAGLWHKADDNFRKGQLAFKEGEYASAKSHFKAALQFAERAENATRLKKFQTGDASP